MENLITGSQVHAYPLKMRRASLIFIILIITGSLFPLLSQSLHTNSARAAKFYVDGSEKFDFFDFAGAEALFRQALAIDPLFFEAQLQLGDLLFKQKRTSESMKCYRAALAIDSLAYKPMLFNLATTELLEGDYQSALIHFRAYLRLKTATEKNKALAVRQINNCLFAIEAVKKPVQFNPVALGGGVNTEADEYWPSLTADGTTLMFTRQSYSDYYPASMTSTQEDFYKSTYADGVWSKAYSAGAPLNTKQNEGAQTISSAGNYMFFTACDRPGGMGSCDLFFAAYRNNNWTIPYNIGPPVNSSSWESTPSVSADGSRLFFSSSRPGGMGGKDIWYSQLKSNGQWAQPVNMGPLVNSPNDEMSPFIHFDGRTLYFASDGRPGMG
jgi:tetratricopeptide (TPR) repeat protein